MVKKWNDHYRLLIFYSSLKIDDVKCQTVELVCINFKKKSKFPGNRINSSDGNLKKSL